MSLSDKKIIITSCVRNCSKFLPSVIKTFLQISSLFHKDSQILFVENDSIDQSKEIIEKYSKQNDYNIKIFSFQGLIHKKTSRTDRLAFCRNFALNFIHQNFSTFDYIIIADCDEVMINFDINGIEKAIKFADKIEPKWGMLSAVSTPKYYDIWALRSKILGINFDCWDLIHHEMSQYGQQARTGGRWRYIEPWQKKIVDNILIPVESAFNGFAIYKLPATKNCKYNGIVKDCPTKQIYGNSVFPSKSMDCYPEVCEHVSFHNDMVKNGEKLFICPLLITRAELTHLVNPK